MSSAAASAGSSGQPSAPLLVACAPLPLTVRCTPCGTLLPRPARGGSARQAGEVSAEGKPSYVVTQVLTEDEYKLWLAAHEAQTHKSLVPAFVQVRETGTFHTAETRKDSTVAATVKRFSMHHAVLRRATMAADGFALGMRIEAVDRKHPQLMGVATIVGVQLEAPGVAKLRIHFDGWSGEYDYWSPSDSSDLFPAGYSQTQGLTLQAPKGYSKAFDWPTYLEEQDALAAPGHLLSGVGGGVRAAEAFAAAEDSAFASVGSVPQSPITATSIAGYDVGMRLEAVDRTHTALTCVANIAEVRPDPTGPPSLRINMDGWTDR